MGETPQEAARLAGTLALSKKAQDVVVLDLRKLSPLVDFFVIATGGSDIQVRAIADAIVDGLGERGVTAWHVEGYRYGRWVLLDYVDFVVHIFRSDARGFYALERLWGDAAREEIV